MPRKGGVKTREVIPDPKFNSKVIARFINIIMKTGKKGVSEKIVYGALDLVNEKLKQDSMEVFRKALENVKPTVEVKSRRVGGATYQVPVEIRPSRKESLAMRWIVDYAASRPGRNMQEKLAAELVDAYGNKGSAIKKKEDTHKMADANKAFAHFRW